MSNSFTVQAGMFNGPLDLLLSLIQERKLYINEVSLASVTDEYLKYMGTLEDVPLAETAQFVLVAATLLLIKSRSLLPSLELTEEEEESIEELERRLAQYRIIKEASQQLLKIWGTSPLHFSKGKVVQVSYFAPSEATNESIKNAANHLLQTLPVSVFRERASVAATISLEEMIEQLQARVLKAARTSFKSLTGGASREEVVVHFLALLELVRGGIISVQQQNSFDDIEMHNDAVTTPNYGS